MKPGPAYTTRKNPRKARALLPGMALILCLALLLAGQGRANETAGGPEQAGSTRLRMDDLEALRLADALLSSGRVSEAGQIYSLLLDSPAQEVRIEAIFQIGNIHMLLEEPGKAVACYISILNSHPELARVRLELARAYFADEDYEKADFHFRLVLGDSGIPAEVAEKINLFLTVIRRHKNWSLSGNVGLAPDSNLNQASGEERECIRTVFGLFCRDLPEKESGLGFKAALHGTHYLRLSKSFGIKSDAGISVLDFKESAYDDNRFTLASGPRVVFPGGEASLQPTFTTRWVGGGDYSKSWGARLNLSFDPAERLGVDTGISFEFNRYDDPLVNSLLKGHTTDAWLDLSYVLSNKSMITAGANLTRDRTKAQSFASDGWGCSVGYYREFPLAFTAYAELRYNRVIYREETWFIRKDGFIEDKTRKDRLYQGYLRLANRRWEASGLTPSITYIYTKRDSNAWNYEYSKHRFEFGIRQSF